MISVIIPAWNAQEFLRDSVDSVLSQSYQNWQLIIVVDLSADDTAILASELSDSDPRITCICMSFQCGAAICRNFGIQYAVGDFIAFLDADDIWLPDKLKEQLPLFDELPYPKIVFSSYSNFNDKDVIFRPISVPHKPILYSDICKTNSIATSTAIYDARSQKTYFPNLSRRQDWGLWIQILEQEGACAVAINKRLALRRLHSNSLSSNRLHSYFFNYIVLRRIAKLSRIRSLANLTTHFFLAFARRI